MELFASNLRKRAVELGISHAEAARRVGLSERRYGNYVSGRREPDLATLVRIAEVLGTSPTELLTERSRVGIRAHPSERIAAAARALPDTQCEIVAVMIEALAEQRAGQD